MMESSTKMEVDTQQRVFALQHLDTGEYICLMQEGTDYLAWDGESIALRQEVAH